MRRLLVFSGPLVVVLAMLTARSQPESLERPVKTAWERLVDDARTAYDRNRTDEAEQFLERAWAMVRDAEPGPELLQLAVGHVASAYEYGEHTVTAEQIYREGIQRAKDDPRTRIELLGGLCGRLSQWGRTAAAEACLTDAYAASVKDVGEDDRETLDLEQSLIDGYEQAGEYLKAHAAFQQRFASHGEIRPAVFSAAAAFYSIYGSKEQFEAVCTQAAHAGASVASCPATEEAEDSQTAAPMGEMNSMQEIVEGDRACLGFHRYGCERDDAFKTAADEVVNRLMDGDVKLDRTLMSLAAELATPTDRGRHNHRIETVIGLAWKALQSGRPELADALGDIAARYTTLRAAPNIAAYYAATRRLEKADAFVQSMLPRARRLQGEDSAAAGLLLAVNLSLAKQRKDRTAVEEAAEALKMFDARVHGPKSQETMMGLLEIAAAHGAVGNASAAESAITEALASCEMISNTPTYRYAEALDYAARVLADLGKLDSAADYNRRAIDIAVLREQPTVLFDATKQYIEGARAAAPLRK